MSSVAGFKQQCPSCGGQLTIKNPALIGKKVDCPQCKFRFIVTEPDDGMDPADVLGDRLDDAMDDTGESRPVGKGAKDKALAAAKKVKAKSRLKAADSATADDAPKKAGIKKTYILAGVAVAVVAIVGLVILFATSGSGDRKTPPGPRPGTGPGAGPGAAKPEESAEARMTAMVERAVSDAAPQAELDGLVQRLAGDNAEERTLGVQKLRDFALKGLSKAYQALEQAAKNPNADLQKLAQDTLKEVDQELARREAGLRNDPTNMLPNNTQVVLSIPVKDFADSPLGTAVLRTRGAFRGEDFQRRIGIPLNNIEQLVMSGNREHNQSLIVVRTFDPMDWDEVKRALQLSADPAATLRGKSYYIGKVDFLSEFVEHLIPMTGLRDKAAVHRKDERTLVFGDVKTIEAFINSPPAFALEPVAAPPKQTFPGAQPPPDAPAEGGQPGGDKPAGVPGAEPPPPPAQSPGYTGIPGRPDLKTFLTLKPALRRLINRAEHRKASLILFAADTSKESPAVLVPYLNRLKPPQASQVQMVAMALCQLEPMSLTVAMMCKSKAGAPAVETELKQILEEAAKGELKDALGFEFLGPWSDWGEPAGTPSTPTPPVAPPGVGRLPYGRDPAIGPSGVSAGGQENTGSPDGATGPTGQTRPPTGPPPGYYGGYKPPQLDTGSPDGGVSGERTPVVQREGSSIDFFRQDEFITVLVTIIDDTRDFNKNVIGPLVTKYRGESDMRSGRFGVGSLIDALRATTKDGFPRGTYERPPSADRRYRPWPPDQRVSWMRELLPHLGDDRYLDLYKGIDTALSWRDPENARVGAALVPQFLHPQGGRYYTRVRGIDWQMAVTHFVGMAGVGLDAPYYDANDPRAGVFGYNRLARKDEIKDGLSNTIAIIQTDPALVGPWIAGGG